MKHFGLKLAAIFCAVSLWFFVVSMKTYQLELDIPLYLENCPNNLAVSNLLPQTILVTLEGTGFDLFRLRNNETLASFRLDLSRAELGRKTFPLDENTFQCGLRKIHFLSSSESSISVDLDTKISQRVPIRLNADLRAANGYLLVGEPEILPPTIRIEGARRSLTKVNEISTDNSILDNLSESDTLKIPLALEGLPFQIKLESKFIRVAVHIEKRVERTFPSVPVQLVGPYQRGVHKIEPSRVDVKISGGQEILSDLKQEDLRLFMEFTRFELERSERLSPTLVIDKPIESWSTQPLTVRLLAGNP